jgi:hypothetical protein
MPCCGAPIYWFRPFQCVHEYEAWRNRIVQLELGL